jgi:hypothetical protein
MATIMYNIPPRGITNIECIDTTNEIATFRYRNTEVTNGIYTHRYVHVEDICDKKVFKCPLWEDNKTIDLKGTIYYTRTRTIHLIGMTGKLQTETNTKNEKEYQLKCPKCLRLGLGLGYIGEVFDEQPFEYRKIRFNHPYRYKANNCIDCNSKTGLCCFRLFDDNVDKYYLKQEQWEYCLRCYYDNRKIVGLDKSKYFEEDGDHADEMETCLMMHFRPDLVRPLVEAGDGFVSFFNSLSTIFKTHICCNVGKGMFSKCFLELNCFPFRFIKSILFISSKVVGYGKV